MQQALNNQMVHKSTRQDKIESETSNAATKYGRKILVSTKHTTPFLEQTDTLSRDANDNDCYINETMRRERSNLKHQMQLQIWKRSLVLTIHIV